MTLDFETQTIVLLIGLAIGAFLSYPLFLLLWKYKIIQRTVKASISLLLIILFLSFVAACLTVVITPWCVCIAVWESFRDNEITDFTGIV